MQFDWLLLELTKQMIFLTKITKMEEHFDIITFQESHPRVCGNHFTVYDIHGVEYTFDTRENLTNMYIPYENITQCGMTNNYLRVVGGDDGHLIYSYQNIIIPINFTDEVTIKYFQTQKFDCPRVLSSINHDTFCERFNYGEDNSKLTPLQEMMFQDIITIIRGFLNDDDQEKNFKEIFDDGFEILEYARYKCSGAIEMIEKHINGIMFEAMHYLSEMFGYGFYTSHLPDSIQIQCM